MSTGHCSVIVNSQWHIKSHQQCKQLDTISHITKYVNYKPMQFDKSQLEHGYENNQYYLNNTYSVENPSKYEFNMNIKFEKEKKYDGEKIMQFNTINSYKWNNIHQAQNTQNSQVAQTIQNIQTHQPIQPIQPEPPQSNQILVNLPNMPTLPNLHNVQHLKTEKYYKTNYLDCEYEYKSQALSKNYKYSDVNESRFISNSPSYSYEMKNSLNELIYSNSNISKDVKLKKSQFSKNCSQSRLSYDVDFRNHILQNNQVQPCLNYPIKNEMINQNLSSSNFKIYNSSNIPKIDDELFDISDLHMYPKNHDNHYINNQSKYNQQYLSSCSYKPKKTQYYSKIYNFYNNFDDFNVDYRYMESAYRVKIMRQKFKKKFKYQRELNHFKTYRAFYRTYHQYSNSIKDYNEMKRKNLTNLKYAFNNIVRTRDKRNRTSFKPDQLIIMKEFFEKNRNPDAKDISKIIAKTKLTKRIIQVWFQNSRAKHRREKEKKENN
ncbi:hypothetical protein A3Q56_01567 [Intoshia linei]|uniref:Homeobox domain-containing protein n=1 Tax=Intoshia linei TaxID=1819745 RepID=A0A177B8Q2_9BILA|nr:hypothetical protein A3Q56_01567 [Intoshia linei]